MSIINIDGEKYQVNKANNLLESCLLLGFNIPYFCWHPALGSVGICRQCTIKKYNNVQDIQGKLILACMTPVVHGTIISIKDHESKKFRQNIIELMMNHHPHDCPVCEEGGSCHLQDMTVMTEQYLRKYRFNKRTHKNQYIGPFIKHEMNRCITCYRCIRFYRDYAGGNDLGVYGIHDNIYFGRIKDGILENEFSGNLIDVCPTGVFTDKIYSKYYSRKWDMQFAPSICQQCSIGCNIIPGERYGKIIRIENRYNSNINRYFLCDRGRFGYEYVNLKNRLTTPLLKSNNNWISLNQEQAIQNVVNALHESDRIIGIGSARASIESNYALLELVGKDNFYIGIGKIEWKQIKLILNILNNGGIYIPSLNEIESYDAILILGEDLTQTSALVALAVRQAIKSKAQRLATTKQIYAWQAEAIVNLSQKDQYPLFITNVDLTKLNDIATWSYCASINDQARFGFAVAHYLDHSAPKVYNLSCDIKNKVELVAKALAGSRKPLIISGSHSGSIELIASAANIAFALQKNHNNVGINLMTTASNSMGVGMLEGGNIDDSLFSLQSNLKNCVILLENDLYRHTLAKNINSALKNINYLIVIDNKYNLIQNKANLVLPSTNFVESNGTIVNYEGRAQRFFQVYNPNFYNSKLIRLESWRWLHFINAQYLNREISWTKFDHVVDAVIHSIPQLSDIKKIAPDSSFRINDQKLARKTHCYSGHTATYANINVHEPSQPQDHDTMFTFSMEGNRSAQKLIPHVALAWSPGWNSSHAWNKFQNKINSNLKYNHFGVRLIKNNFRTLNWFNCVPSKFVLQKNNSLYIVPYWHLFGSEETSQCAETIKKCIPKPYAIISHLDTLNVDINNNSIMIFNCAGIEFVLPVKLSNNLNVGQIGLPVGLLGIPPILIGLHAKNIKIIN